MHWEMGSCCVWWCELSLLVEEFEGKLLGGYRESAVLMVVSVLCGLGWKMTDLTLCRHHHLGWHVKGEWPPCRTPVVLLSRHVVWVFCRLVQN